MRAIAVLSVVLVAFAASWAGQIGVDEAANAAGYKLMKDLGAKPTDCPPGSAAFGEFSVRICGRVGRQLRRDANELKRRIDASLASGGEDSDHTEPEWTSHRKFHSRTFSVGKVFGTLAVDQRSGDVVFQYPQQFDSCLTTQVDAHEEDSEDAQLPVLIEESARPPSYPELARVARIEAVVSLEALIREDGSVGEVCVQRVSRPGMGFGEEARRAVEQWRYQPAMLDGVPVKVRFHVVVTFVLQ